VVFSYDKSMKTKGRALYNLIRMNWEEDPSLPAETWQVEDYRSLRSEELFDRLSSIGISLDEERFLSYSEQASSPEELIETLWVGESYDYFDKAYLTIFELWRRLRPEKQSLSIFCNELDTLIGLYDTEELENEEILYSALSDLERILEEQVDQEEDPKIIFQEISQYCAHDIESFIFDLASHEIDKDNTLQASGLIDGFSSYINDEHWFEFLQLRLLASSDSEEADPMLARILEDQKEEPDFELLLEIARFLIEQGKTNLFFEVAQDAKDLIETEQDFQELLALTGECYLLLNKEAKANKIIEILKQRQKIPLEQEISASDKDFKLIDDLDRSEA